MNRGLNKPCKLSSVFYVLLTRSQDRRALEHSERCSRESGGGRWAQNTSTGEAASADEAVTVFDVSTIHKTAVGLADMMKWFSLKQQNKDRFRS